MEARVLRLVPEGQERTGTMARQAAAYLVLALGAALALNAVLGPLLLGVIEYRFSESLINQGIGLDFVSLVFVAPIAVLAAALMLRGHAAGPLLATAVALYAGYMAVQYAIGPEYLTIAGNNEQFFLLHLAIFTVAVATGLFAWTAAGEAAAPEVPATRRKVYAGILLVIGVGMVFRYLPVVAGLTAGNPAFAEYEENATSFLLIAWLDLGIFTPAAFAGAVGLLRGWGWGVRLGYAVAGWYAMVGAAVAAMMVTMYVNDDPNASLGAMIGFVIVGAVLMLAAAAFYVPALRRRG